MSDSAASRVVMIWSCWSRRSDTKRRLYDLLPDRKNVEKLVDDLEGTAISKQDVHAVAKDKFPMNNIGAVHATREKDRDYFVEWFLWRFNLGLFFVALIAFVAMIIWVPGR